MTARFLITEAGAYLRLNAIDLIEQVVGGYMATTASGKTHRLAAGFSPTDITVIRLSATPKKKPPQPKRETTKR
jgi:crotonobetainyl-CoA:carnitine CoA-transferase CaiB-like acyl-CoA transferase